MKPVLLIGLGNSLMGDDGIGCAVADRLAADSRLPDSVEVISGGTDLLRFMDQVEGRARVIIIDAVQDGGEPGTLSVIDAANDRQEHVHHLSVTQAIQLLKLTSQAKFTLLGVSVSSVEFGAGLSPALEARLGAIVSSVLDELSSAA